MDVHLLSDTPVIETIVGDINIKIRFGNQETQGVREAIINALTASYEKRIQRELNGLCNSLEPKETDILPHF